ncbi:MAG: hypothetical protein AAFX06_24525, partial [Planctomycetota bacterium]
MSHRFCLLTAFCLVSLLPAQAQQADSTSKAGSLAEKLNRLKATRKSGSVAVKNAQRNPIYD